MERYVETAGRLRWILIAIVLLVAIPGLASAYREYVSSHESFATVWVDRASAQFVTAADDARVPVLQSPASEQSEILNQLLQTRSFMAQLVQQTVLQGPFASASDGDAFLDEQRKRFRIQALGTNLVRISFRSSDPELAAAMVDAALEARSARILEAQAANSAAATVYYGRVYELAQREVIDAQVQLDAFTSKHATGTLSATDEYRQRQLRLALDLATARVSELKSRSETAGVASQLRQITGDVDFAVIDRPVPNYLPSGGLRTASLLAGVSVAGAIALAMLLIAIATLANDRMRSIGDVLRFPGVRMLAAVPRAPYTHDRRTLRAQLLGAALPAAAPGDASAPDQQG